MQLKHVNSCCSKDLSRFQQLTKVACIKFNEHYKLYVIGIVLDIPSLYLDEVCQRIHNDLLTLSTCVRVTVVVLSVCLSVCVSVCYQASCYIPRLYVGIQVSLGFLC